MKVSAVMTTNVITIGPDATLTEAARRMRGLDIGPLPVADGDRLVGMLTDRDIAVRATAEGRDPSATRVSDVMTRDVVCCFEDDEVLQAARTMARYLIEPLDQEGASLLRQDSSVRAIAATTSSRRSWSIGFEMWNWKPAESALLRSSTPA